MPDLPYTIIGGGAVGRSVAYALRQRSDEDIAVIESSSKHALENQSTRNSGVIHAGIYYQKAERPLKARLCIEGNALLYAFCRENDVHHARCGKLVVATSSLEDGYLDAVMRTATDNQVPGVRMLDAAAARAMEPNVVARRALFAPSSGVIDAAGFLQALRRKGHCHNLDSTRVIEIRKRQDAFEIATESPSGREVFSSRVVINAGGLYADDIARMINPHSRYQILPVRGEASKFYRSRRSALSMTGMNVYPVPHGFYKQTGQRARVPYARYCELLAAGDIIDTLGVHLSPTLDADGAISKVVTVGPIVTTGTGKGDFGQGLREPAEYLERVNEFFPGLRAEDLELHQAGIQARLASGLDWVIERDATHAGFINLVGIDSPGLTGSLAIGEYVVDALL